MLGCGYTVFNTNKTKNLLTNTQKNCDRGVEGTGIFPTYVTAGKRAKKNKQNRTIEDKVQTRHSVLTLLPELEEQPFKPS